MSLGGVSENDRECWWTARMHFVYVCVFWISMLCAFACTTHVHVHLYMYHPCVSSMLGWFAFVNLCVHACMYAYVSVCVRVADYWAGMPCGFMLFHTKQWNRYLFVTDKTGWPEIGMHIITRAHTLGSIGAALCAYARTALTGVCFVHAICACAWAVHSFKDTMHSPSYSFHFPRDKVPISPLPAVRERKMGGGGSEQEEKSGIVVKRKPRCYQPTESHQGHCHVSVSVTQLSLISPSDCCDFAAMGYSVIPFCVGTSDETQN